ncbi:MAG: hypothetical protein ACK4RZ_00360 [Paracoccaceae bacterium]
MAARIFRTLADNASLVQAVTLIAGLWVASDLGYYFVLPALDLNPDYNQSPVSIATYYTFWVGVAVIVFFKVYCTWPIYAKWIAFENRAVSLVLWVLFFACATSFTGIILPALPPFEWLPEWGTVPELPQANTLYFLPKSIEILFQQLLVIALVLTLSAGGFSLRKISVLCALLFGGVHVLLVFDQVPWSFVIRFVVLATVFGGIFPVLILRVRNGFAYSYAIHWGYYALTIYLARAVGPETFLRYVGTWLGGG